MFEIEFRGKLQKKEFDKLKKFLEVNAKNLGQDDKDCYFYIFKDKLLKVVNNTSKSNAKLSLKLNRIGDGASFPEIEFYFSQNDFEKAALLFENLSLPAKVMYESQIRTNYKYRDCEIAMKYSDTWGYHFEIEKVVELECEQKKAEDHIYKVAEDLGVSLMTEEELKIFVEEVENKII